MTGVLAGGALMGTHPAAAATNDLPRVSIDDLRVPEGNGGIRAHPVTIRLSRPSPKPVTVTVRTSNCPEAPSGGICNDPVPFPNFAGAGSDYLPMAVTTTFPPGTTTRQIFVTIVGDTRVEPDEFFLLHISTDGNARLATVYDDALSNLFGEPLESTKVNVVTIVNDDVHKPSASTPAPHFQISDITKP